MRNNRDKSLDIAKAICIILMVVGHSGCPTYLYDFVYMFHMPCFFFCKWLAAKRKIRDGLENWIDSKGKRFLLSFCQVDVDFPAFP